MSVSDWLLRFEWWLDQTARGRLGGVGVLLVVAVAGLGVASWLALAGGAPAHPRWARRRLLAILGGAARRAAAATTFSLR